MGPKAWFPVGREEKLKLGVWFMDSKDKITKNTGPNSVKRKKMALGKGLGALIPDIETEQDNKKDFFYTV